MLAMLQVVVVALGSWGLGRTLIGPRLRRLHPALRFSMQSAVGLLAVSLVVFAQMMIGVGAGSLLVLTGLMALIATVEVARWWRDTEPPRLRLHGLDWLGLGLAAAWSLWVWASALVPPTGIDELIYHLEVPRRILEFGRFRAFTDNVYAFFPQSGDALILLGLGVGGETAARLFHGLCALLTGIAVYGAARSLTGRGPSLLAAAAYMTVPTGLVIASWAYVDHHFTLYTFLALIAVVQLTRLWEEEPLDLPGDETPPSAGPWAWAVLAGLMAGGAWASKYTGLQLTLLLLLVALFEILRGKRRGFPLSVAALPMVAFALFLPYLVRNWWMTGWPLFPFAIGPFELREGFNWDAERADLFMAWLAQFGGGPDRTLLDKLVAPLDVFVSARFDDLTAYDGMAGPVFLLAPLAWIGRSSHRTMRVIGLFSVLYLVYWAFTTTQVRFLLPVLPGLAVLVAVAVAGRFGRWLMPLAMALVLAAGGLGVRQFWQSDPWEWWTGDTDREGWIGERVSGALLYARANELLGVGDRVYLVNMRTFGYLFDLPETDAAVAREMLSGAQEPFPAGFRGDYVFQQFSLSRALENAASPADLDAFFRAQGVTHLMLDERLTLSQTALATRDRDRLVAWLRERGRLLARNPRAQGQSLWKLEIP